MTQKCNSCLEVPAGLESAVTAAPAAVPSAVSACPQQREAPAILYCKLLAQASARHILQVHLQSTALLHDNSSDMSVCSAGYGRKHSKDVQEVYCQPCTCSCTP